jgi:predicted aspartyl protease
VQTHRWRSARDLLQLGYEQVELRRTDENRLFLFARVNGRKRSCLVDSGWSFTTISTNTAARLANSNIIDRLELGGVLLTNRSVVTQDIRINGQPASFDVVLGCDFLLAHHAVLDCANRRLYLRRTALTQDEAVLLEKPLSDSSRVSAQMKLRNPPTITVAAQLNGHDTELLVDSGAMWSCLDTKVAREFNLRLSPSPNQISGAVTADEKSFLVTTVRELTVAERKIKDVNLAVLSLEAWGFGPDGKLFSEVSGILGGAELIANGAVLDFSAKKLWLRSVR